MDSFTITSADPAKLQRLTVGFIRGFNLFVFSAVIITADTRYCTKMKLLVKL